ncbi:MAG: sugar phosphate isomerase/epimerase family protein [Terriglobia bacterium]
MKTKLNRRDFTKAIALGAAGALSVPSLRGETPRRLKIGHTGITWGYPPSDAPQAITDIGSLGYWGFETFGTTLEAWQSKGGLESLLERHKLPFHSGYCTFNMVDPAQRKDEIDKMVRWGHLIKHYGGSVSVMGPNGVDRKTYDFKAHKADIVTSLNETAKALADIGLIAALHQHTGTCVMTHDEVYAVLDAVDTRYVHFGPDVGQLTKAGSDAAKVVQDFLPLIRHVHLKDYDGSKSWNGYCPLGEGKVDIPKILDLLEGSGNQLMIMVELDPPSPGAPISAFQRPRSAPGMA